MVEKLQDDFDSLTTSVDKMREDGHSQQKSLEELFRLIGHLQVKKKQFNSGNNKTYADLYDPIYMK